MAYNVDTVFLGEEGHTGAEDRVDAIDQRVADEHDNEVAIFKEGFHILTEGSALHNG